MTESNIDILIKTKRSGDAPQETLKELEGMKTGLTNLEKAMVGTRSTIGGLDRDLGGASGQMGSMADAMSGLGIALPITPMMLFGEALRAGGQFAKDSMAEYSAYVDQISKMASYTSTSTEEMSRLYQVADDLRIPLGDLEMALKTMTGKGTAPSIAGIEQLSEKYLAIQDPLQKAQFLTDNFGRAGQEMGRLLEMGAVGIDAAADSIANWMIVTGKSEQEIKDYLATQDRWGEAMDEIKYQFAMGVTPTITKFMTAILDSNDEINNAQDAWWKWVPAIRAIVTVFTELKNIFDNFKTPDIPGIATPNSGTNSAGVSSNQGGNTSRGSIYDSKSYGNLYTDKGPTNSGPITVTVNYQPSVSLGDQKEAERVLVPMVQQALRAAK